MKTLNYENDAEAFKLLDQAVSACVCVSTGMHQAVCVCVRACTKRCVCVYGHAPICVVGGMPAPPHPSLSPCQTVSASRFCSRGDACYSIGYNHATTYGFFACAGRPSPTHHEQARLDGRLCASSRTLETYRTVFGVYLIASCTPAYLGRIATCTYSVGPIFVAVRSAQRIRVLPCRPLWQFASGCNRCPWFCRWESWLNSTRKIRASLGSTSTKGNRLKSACAAQGTKQASFRESCTKPFSRVIDPRFQAMH